MDWVTLAPGVELAQVQAPERPRLGDGELVVVRVDPAVARLEVAEHRSTSVRETLEERGWVAAINAGMFEPDRTATFELRAGDPPNNPKRAASAGSFLVAGPSGAKLLDRECDDVGAIDQSWPIVVQGYRVRTCTGAVPWTDADRIWSQSVLASDHAGRLLLVHSRSPWSIAAMARVLHELPLDVDRVMYLEGGPEASLAARTPAGVREWVGSYETGFHESDDNTRGWAIPNVLGVAAYVPPR
jgi:hypothetical protein